MQVSDFLILDAVPLATLVLSAILCAALGVFLAPRRQLMTADAIGHLVAPGLVVAFLVTGNIHGSALIFGAAGAVTVGALTITWLRNWAGIDQGASIGIVFTVMFALGIVLIETLELGNVHLDAAHILFGNVQGLIWPAASSPSALLEPQTWALLPEELWALCIILICVLMALWLSARLLGVVGFDPVYASVRGLPVGAVNLGIMFISGLALLATFQAVGVILAVALLACPAATARCFSNKISVQVVLAIAMGGTCATVGYMLAAFSGLGIHFHAGGTIALISGSVMAITLLFQPRQS